MVLTILTIGHVPFGEKTFSIDCKDDRLVAIGTELYFHVIHLGRHPCATHYIPFTFTLIFYGEAIIIIV